MSATSIEWATDVWNPTVGCTRVSSGCRECYAFALHDKRHKAHKAGKNLPAQYAKPFTELQLMEDRLTDPLHWKKPRRVFVNSVSDLFHKDIPDSFLDRVFAVMAMAPRHTFMVLTKRADRMREYATAPYRPGAIQDACRLAFDRMDFGADYPMPWPLPSVWLGVSCENQAAADERIPELLKVPARIRFLSCEPLLGPVDVSKWLVSDFDRYCRDDRFGIPADANRAKVGWVIVGGESGGGARPMHPRWARSLRDQCVAAGTAFFFKQWGETWPVESTDPVCGRTSAPFADGQLMERVGKKAAGRHLDGRTWDEFPEVARA